jgi:hypothetical protein
MGVGGLGFASGVISNIRVASAQALTGVPLELDRLATSVCFWPNCTSTARCFFPNVTASPIGMSQLLLRYYPDAC